MSFAPTANNLSIPTDAYDCSIPFFNVDVTEMETIQSMEDFLAGDQLSSSSSGTQSRVYTQLKFPTILTSEDDGQPIHADALDRQPKRGRKKRNLEEANGKGELVPQQKTPYYIKNPFPRILKRDPRRIFGQMYLNVVNSGDSNLLVKFMRRFFQLDAQYQRFHQEGPILVQSNDIPIIEGRESIMLFLASHLETAPDMVAISKAGSIRQRLNSDYSEVLIDVKMEGTRLYLIDMHQLKELIESHNNHSNNLLLALASSCVDYDETSTRSATSSSSSSSSSASSNSVPKRAPATKEEIAELALTHFTDMAKRMMLSSPVHFVLEGTWTMYLDEHFNVYRMDFTRSNLTLEEIPSLNPYKKIGDASTIDTCVSSVPTSSLVAEHLDADDSVSFTSTSQEDSLDMDLETMSSV